VNSRWTRTHEAFGARAALDAVDHGTPWAVLWCAGSVSRSEETRSAARALARVRASLIEPAERERLFEKAQRKGRTKTVIMAERWEDQDRKPLILFYETGPYLLPDRDEPVDKRALG